MGVTITNTLMPIQQRNHRAVDVRLEVIIDTSSKANQSHTRLHTEMIAEHKLKIGSSKAAAALQETR